MNTPKAPLVEIHYKRPALRQMPKICSREEAYNYIIGIINLNRMDHKEFFWVILLNNANRVLGVSELGVGTTNGCLVNVKEVLQLALLSNSSKIVLCHNHPSGTLAFSESDHKITDKITKACSYMDIEVLDHLIITSEGYHAYATQ